MLSFFGIMCHVGIDVGTNTTAPKILMERLGLTLRNQRNNDDAYVCTRNGAMPVIPAELKKAIGKKKMICRSGKSATPA